MAASLDRSEADGIRRRLPQAQARRHSRR